MRSVLCKMFLVCFAFSSISSFAMLANRRRFSSAVSVLGTILEDEAVPKSLPPLPASVELSSPGSGFEGPLLFSVGRDLLCHSLIDLYDYMSVNPSFRGLVRKDGSDVKYVVEDFSCGNYAIRVCC